LLPDIKKSRQNPLLHYILVGAKKGYNPHPWFDSSFYIANSYDVKHSGINPLLHFLHTGWKKGLDPHPLFDTSFYLKNNLESIKQNINPLVHYATIGIKKKAWINPLGVNFDYEAPEDVTGVELKTSNVKKIFSLFYPIFERTLSRYFTDELKAVQKHIPQLLAELINHYLEPR